MFTHNIDVRRVPLIDYKNSTTPVIINIRGACLLPIARCCNMSSTLPWTVMGFTVDEMMEIGLRLEGASIERSSGSRLQRNPLIDDFKGCYEVHPKVLAEIWVELQINPIDADRIRVRKNTVNIKNP